MIVADVLLWFLVITGTYLIFISYWLASRALFEGFVENCRQRIETHPVRQAVLGLTIALPTILLGLALLNGPNPAMKLLGATVILALILAGLIGSTGLAAQVGAGLPSPRDLSQPWRRVLRGGAVLGLTFVFPILGWFVILPLALLMGIGAAWRSVRKTVPVPVNHWVPAGN